MALLLLLLVSYFGVISTLNNSLHIIVMTPPSPSKTYDGEPLWAEEDTSLLPTVYKAVSDVNNSSDILVDYELEAIPICVSHSDPYKGIVEFVSVLSGSYNKNINVVGVVGLFDNVLANAILPVLGREQIDFIQLIDPTAVHLDSDKRYCHLFTMLPNLEAQTKASLHLLLALNWTKIALVYNSSLHDHLYTSAVENILAHSNDISEKNISVQLIDIEQNKITNKTNFNENIFLTVLPPQTLAVLLCTVYEAELLWPEYAWITLDHNGQLQDIIATYNCTNKQRLTEVMENVILVNSLGTTAAQLNHMDCVTNINLPWETPQANYLYDSIWGLSLALNNSVETLHQINLSLGDYGPGKSLITMTVEQQLANLSFCGSRGQVTIGAYPSKQNNVVQIMQIKSGQCKEIGSYSTQLQELYLNISLLGVIPNAHPDIVNVYDIFPQSLTITLSLTTGICFLFTTVVLILFICYRNEPEVKATSVWLSLCMFIGCYMLLAGTLAHFITSGIIVTSSAGRITICNFEIFNTNVGLDLILATLLFKVLRIWRIFSIGMKTGKLWTDRAMLLFIGLIVLVKVLVLVIWMAVDMHTLTDVKVFTQKISFGLSYKLVQQCESNTQAVWLVINYGYSVLLGFCLIAASIKTRKIKQGNFKDTKKINILIVSLIYAVCVTGSIWGVLRISGNSRDSKIILGLTYCIASLLCVIILFLPKLVPPIRRQLRADWPMGTQASTRSFTNTALSTEKSTVH